MIGEVMDGRCVFAVGGPAETRRFRPEPGLRGVAVSPGSATPLGPLPDDGTHGTHGNLRK